MKKDETRYFITMLLSMWFGFLAIDRFYLAQFNKGHFKWAIWKFFTLGGLGIWWIADLIYIAKNRRKFNEIVIANNWQWRKYSRTVAPVTTICALLGTFILIYFFSDVAQPPVGVNINPAIGDVGTRFEVNVTGLKPWQVIKEKVAQVKTQEVKEEIEYRANWYGTLNFFIPSSSFEKGDYICEIRYGSSTKSANFIVNGTDNGFCRINPPKGVVGTNFSIECASMPGLTAEYKIIEIADSASYIIETEEATIAKGKFSITIDSSGYHPGNYLCLVQCGNLTENVTFRVEPPPYAYCVVHPHGAPANDTFEIKCYGLNPRQMAKYSINKIDKDIEKNFGTGEAFTDSNGSIILRFNNPKCETGKYQCRVKDNQRTVSDNFSVIACTCYSEWCNLCERPEKNCCAPRFVLRSLRGDQVVLQNEIGTPIWINFWNISCPGCSEYMKIIQYIYENWPYGDIKVFSINTGDDEVKIRKFLDERNYTFYKDPNYPVLLDTSRTVKNLYRPGGDPPHYFLCEQGIIKEHKVGFESINTLEEVRKILSNCNKD